MAGILHIEAKGRMGSHRIRMSTSEWRKGVHLGNSNLGYAVSGALGLPIPRKARQPHQPIPDLLPIQNLFQRLVYAKRELVTARYYHIPAGAVEDVAENC